jgi:predicted RNA-binding Zn-ribbon protein involved in translation (DUF1610 family)
MVERANITIRPQNRACPLPGMVIDPARLPYFKRIKPYERQTSKGAAWRSWVDDTGKAVNFKCPECGEIYTYDHDSKCKWTPDKLTSEERADIERGDPKMIPMLCYLEKIKLLISSFDRNLKKISGKERREKRFLGKCAAVK